MESIQRVKKSPMGMILAIIIGLAIMYVIYRVIKYQFGSPNGGDDSDSDDEEDAPRRSQGRGDYPQLIFFHGDWCPHCQRMMPAWNEAKSRLSSKGIKCIDIESADSRIQNYSDVQGFPTVRLYSSHTTFVEYTGDRTADSLVDFASSGAGAAAKEPCVGCDEGDSEPRPTLDETSFGTEGIRKRRNQYLAMSE